MNEPGVLENFVEVRQARPTRDLDQEAVACWRQHRAHPGQNSLLDPRRHVRTHEIAAGLRESVGQVVPEVVGLSGLDLPAEQSAQERVAQGGHGTPVNVGPMGVAIAEAREPHGGRVAGEQPLEHGRAAAARTDDDDGLGDLGHRSRRPMAR
jgi:hypothetical protein